MDAVPPPTPPPPPPPFSAPPPIPPAAPQSATTRNKGWWGRNWLWVLPSGCLTLLALGACVVLLIMTIVFGAMKSTDIYKDALRRARKSPEVTKALGKPVKDSFFFSGKTTTEGGSGEANLSIQIHGPKGKGTLYVVATKAAGEWSYETLALEVAKTGKRIDLTDHDGASDKDDDADPDVADDDDSI